jgi:hypothetical protein
MMKDVTALKWICGYGVLKKLVVICVTLADHFVIIIVQEIGSTVSKYNMKLYLEMHSTRE